MATEAPLVPTLSPSMTPSDVMMSPMPSDGMMSMDMREFDLDATMDDEFGLVARKKKKKPYVFDQVSVSANRLLY
jgi:hypothetical protein